MNLFFKKLKPHIFLLAIWAIILIAIILRIYNINERSGLGSDSTRDALIAQEALRRGELPLIGSFSSAGPFVFGPLYFWFNMLALMILPFSFKTPWILMNITGVLTVIVMILCGYFISGKRLAIILGFFTAFAPQLVSRSTGLTQHSLVAITSALLLLFFILLWKRKSIKYAFFMGISMGTALSMHYQALNFFIFLPFIFFIPRVKFKKKLIASFLFTLGVVIPSIPLLYWDMQQDFANTRNLLDYMFIGQYRIYVPNSWRIFLFQSLIDYWSNVVGGNKVISGILMLLVPLTIFISFIKRRLPGVITCIAIIFFILLLVLRYYRGERFDGYLIYIAPFILLLTAWTFSFLLEITANIKSRTWKNFSIYFLYTCVLLIIVFDFKNASQFIFVKNNHQKDVRLAETFLMKKFPGEKFQLYDYQWLSSDISYPLGGFLRENGKTSPEGRKIGVVRNKLPISTVRKPLYQSGYWQLIDLEGFPTHQIRRPEWAPVNPPDIYDDLMKWQKTEKLKSTFFLDKFIEEKLKGN